MKLHIRFDARPEGRGWRGSVTITRSAGSEWPRVRGHGTGPTKATATRAAVTSALNVAKHPLVTAAFPGAAGPLRLASALLSRKPGQPQHVAMSRTGRALAQGLARFRA